MGTCNLYYNELVKEGKIEEKQLLSLNPSLLARAQFE
jgi:hypothetical protein